MGLLSPNQDLAFRRIFILLISEKCGIYFTPATSIPSFCLFSSSSEWVFILIFLSTGRAFVLFSSTRNLCFIPAIFTRWEILGITDDNSGSSLAPAEHLGLRLSWGHIPSPGSVCIAWDLQSEDQAVAHTSLLQEWLNGSKKKRRSPSGPGESNAS